MDSVCDSLRKLGRGVTGGSFSSGDSPLGHAPNFLRTIFQHLVWIVNHVELVKATMQRTRHKRQW